VTGYATIRHQGLPPGLLTASVAERGGSWAESGKLQAVSVKVGEGMDAM
jgi:hypothetical protein